MSLGAGLSAAGISFAGFGTPDSVPTVGKPFEGQSSRRIDPATKDYVLTPDGRIAGMNATQQMVYLATTTELHSCVLYDLGSDLSSIKTFGTSTIQKIKDSVTRTLSYLVNNSFIALLNIQVDRIKDSAVIITVTYRDINTNEILTVSV